MTVLHAGQGPLEVRVRRLSSDLSLPSYAHPGDAGLDLHAAATVRLGARGGRAVVPTGLAFAIPRGYAGFIQPRSGLAAAHGISVLNSPGLIDSSYRGEVKVILINTDPVVDYQVEVGERIAQLVIQRVIDAHLIETSDLGVTERGSGGFGHSGS